MSYYALQFMTFADMNTISMCSPVYVAPLAWLFLKEQCKDDERNQWDCSRINCAGTLIQMGTIAVTVVGVVLVTRPTVIFPPAEGAAFTPTESAIGAGLALIAALGLSTGIL